MVIECDTPLTDALRAYLDSIGESTPSNGGTDLFILHEGTHVSITDATMQQWVEIRMADGKAGWLERNAIAII